MSSPGREEGYTLQRKAYKSHLALGGEYTGDPEKEFNRRSHKSPNMTYAATYAPTADPTVKIISSSPSA